MHIHPPTLAALGLAGLLIGAPSIASAQRTARAHHVAHHTHHDADADSDVVLLTPPAPPVVARPPRPFSDAVWTEGYWTWNGNGFVWVDGTWMHAIPGRRWVPWRWDYQHGHWTLIPGGWVPSHEGHL